MLFQIDTQPLFNSSATFGKYKPKKTLKINSSFGKIFNENTSLREIEKYALLIYNKTRGKRTYL